MSATDGSGPHGQPGSGDVTKRDFLKLVAGAGAAVGVGAIAWPLVDSMNPSQDVLALATVEVPLGPIEVGQGITVSWRGKPVFVRHRTAKEIKDSEAVKQSDLIEPATDVSRRMADHPEWIVLVGICTHLGCIPLGNKSSDPRGEYGGWFCPCHGSEYDVAGRVRRGPAPLNLYLLPYKFDTDTKITLGAGTMPPSST